jgi:hypothetical protein
MDQIICIVPNLNIKFEPFLQYKEFEIQYSTTEFRMDGNEIFIPITFKKFKKIYDLCNKNRSFIFDESFPRFKIQRYSFKYENDYFFIEYSSSRKDLSIELLNKWFYNNIRIEYYIQILILLFQKSVFLLLIQFMNISENFKLNLYKIWEFKYWVLRHHLPKDIAKLIDL